MLAHYGYQNTLIPLLHDLQNFNLVMELQVVDRFHTVTSTSAITISAIDNEMQRVISSVSGNCHHTQQ